MRYSIQPVFMSIRVHDTTSLEERLLRERSMRRTGTEQLGAARFQLAHAINRPLLAAFGASIQPDYRSESCVHSITLR